MSIEDVVYLAGCKVNLITGKSLLEKIKFSLSSRKKPLIITSANMQHLGIYGIDGSHSYFFDELEYENKFQSLCILDGSPLVKHAEKIKNKSYEKLSGSDIILPIIELCIKENKKFGILGGPDTLSNDFAQYASIHFPKLNFESWHPSREELESPASSIVLAKKIKKSKIDFLCVSLPKPISELWIKSYGVETGAKVLAAFGASINFLIGIQKRSPKIFQTLGVEWVWRLLSEPKRLFKRYLLEGFGEYLRMILYSGEKRFVASPKLWRNRLTHALLLIDIVALSLASLLASLARISFGPSFTGYSPSWFTVISAIPLVILVSGFFKSRTITSSRIDADNYLNLIYGILAGISVLGLISYSFRLETSRGYLLLLTVFGLLFSLLGRFIFSYLLTRSRRKGYNLINLAHIGSSTLGNDIISRFKNNSSYGYRVLNANLTITNANSYGAGVVAADGFTANEISDADSVKEDHTEIIILPQISHVASNRLSHETIGVLSLLHLLPVELGGYRAYVKMILDYLLTFCSLLVFFPIFVLTALFIWLEDRGPIFFTQLRVGKNGKIFKLYKFRSMHINAEELLNTLQSQNQAGDILFKIQDDPRVTKVGKFIRKWSLDELPQLINVIKADMSLVGPRPALPVEVAKYPSNGHDRHLVKPGITGLWQVSGRSNLNSQEALELDLFYVTNWSVNTDLLILTKTLKAVISKDGAY